jgi:RHS repeat-associated protein
MTTTPQPGNETSGLTCVYDAWGHLDEVLSGTTVLATYQYDGFGSVIAINENGVTTDRYYANGQLLESIERAATSPMDGATYVTEQYVWSARDPNALISRTETTFTYSTSTSTWTASTPTAYFYLTDANNNVTAVTNSSGSVVERYAYGAYGTVTIYNATWTVISTTAINNTFLFATMQVDAVTGLSDDDARWYSTSLDTFLTPDPAQADPNTYRYVFNDSTTLTDPTGLGGLPGDPGGTLIATYPDSTDPGRCTGKETGNYSQSILTGPGSLAANAPPGALTLMPPFDLSQIKLHPLEPEGPQMRATPGYDQLVQTMTKGQAGSILSDQAFQNRPDGYYSPAQLAAAETVYTQDMSTAYYIGYVLFTPRAYEPGLGPITNFSMAVDMAGAANGAYRMVSGASNAGVTPHELGVNGENSASATSGACKNTQSFPVNGRNRIPDQVLASDVATRRPVHVAEVKNRQYQAYTQQLKDDVSLVGRNGKVDVYLPPGARVSGPLQEAFGNPRNPLNRVPLEP